MIAITTANLGNFDTPIDPVQQDIDAGFKRFTDENFPPIAGLTPRLQYRIPKMFSWQMLPGYECYIWLDGSVSLMRENSALWLLDQLGDGDIALFKHPWRDTIKKETDFIEERLKRGDKYLTPRYQNGLHKEQYADISLDTNFVDDKLYASTAFIYRDSEKVRDALRMWWLHTSRYFTVDQLALPYVTKDLDVRVINENPFKGEHVSLVSEHK